MGEKRNVYRLLVGKPEGKRPLGRPRRRWIDNIKMDLLEMGVSVVDWTGLQNVLLQIKDKTMDNGQNCDSHISITLLSSLYQNL
jgi:hypothetical protein